MTVVPILAHVGFSEACSNEIITIGTPIVTGAILLAFRKLKGDVAWSGFRVDLRK